MIANFYIGQNSTIPFLQVSLTKNGVVPLAQQAPSYECTSEEAKTDPNLVDLTDAESVKFEMYKCGRTPLLVATQGEAEIVQGTVTEGSITKVTNLGVVQYKWHPDDTSVPGLYYGRFIVTFKDGRNFVWPYQLESLSIEVA